MFTGLGELALYKEVDSIWEALVSNGSHYNALLEQHHL
jgi:hypothetical protein